VSNKTNSILITDEVVSLEVSVFGTGYVGLVQAVALADAGHHVVCVDLDSHKMAQLQRAIPPTHEAPSIGLPYRVPGALST